MLGVFIGNLIVGKVKFGPKVIRVCRQLGSQVKRSRLARKITQELVAERSRISVSTMKRIENGDPSVALGSFLMVLHALSILPDGLGIDDELGEQLLLMEERERAPRMPK